MNQGPEGRLPRCPISQEPFQVPVVLQTGQSYEQEAWARLVEEGGEGGARCPVTRQVIEAGAVRENYALKEAMVCMTTPLDPDEASRLLTSLRNDHQSQRDGRQFQEGLMNVPCVAMAVHMAIDDTAADSLTQALHAIAILLTSSSSTIFRAQLTHMHIGKTLLCKTEKGWDCGESEKRVLELVMACGLVLLHPSIEVGAGEPIFQVLIAGEVAYPSHVEALRLWSLCELLDKEVDGVDEWLEEKGGMAVVAAAMRQAPMHIMAQRYGSIALQNLFSKASHIHGAVFSAVTKAAVYALKVFPADPDTLDAALQLLLDANGPEKSVMAEGLWALERCMTEGPAGHEAMACRLAEILLQEGGERDGLTADDVDGSRIAKVLISVIDASADNFHVVDPGCGALRAALRICPTLVSVMHHLDLHQVLSKVVSITPTSSLLRLVESLLPLPYIGPKLRTVGMVAAMTTKIRSTCVVTGDVLDILLLMAENKWLDEIMEEKATAFVERVLSSSMHMSVCRMALRVARSLRRLQGLGGRVARVLTTFIDYGQLVKEVFDLLDSRASSGHSIKTEVKHASEVIIMCLGRYSDPPDSEVWLSAVRALTWFYSVNCTSPLKSEMSVAILSAAKSNKGMLLAALKLVIHSYVGLSSHFFSGPQMPLCISVIQHGIKTAGDDTDIVEACCRAILFFIDCPDAMEALEQPDTMSRLLAMVKTCVAYPTTLAVLYEILSHMDLSVDEASGPSIIEVVIRTLQRDVVRRAEYTQSPWVYSVLYSLIFQVSDGAGVLIKNGMVETALQVLGMASPNFSPGTILVLLDAVSKVYPAEAAGRDACSVLFAFFQRQCTLVRGHASLILQIFTSISKCPEGSRFFQEDVSRAQILLQVTTQRYPVSHDTLFVHVSCWELLVVLAKEHTSVKAAVEALAPHDKISRLASTNEGDAGLEGLGRLVKIVDEVFGQPQSKKRPRSEPEEDGARSAPSREE